MGFSVDDLDALDDIWMLHTLHDLYLSIKIDFGVFLVVLLFGDDLDGINLFRPIDVVAKSDFSKCSFSNSFA